MFNVGGGELLVILLIALIVLGPTKLPEAARQIGSVARELRRMSTSFQAEIKSALDDPVESAARERGHKVVSSEERAAPTTDDKDAPSGAPSHPARSTAAAAGMYDVAPPANDQDADADEDPATDEAAAAPAVEDGEDPEALGDVDEAADPHAGSGP